jgi:hypothetical protein
MWTWGGNYECNGSKFFWRFVFNLIGQHFYIVWYFVLDLAATDIRGRIVSLYQCSACFGIFIAYGINIPFSLVYNGWKYEFALAMLPAVILVVICFFLPEGNGYLEKKLKKEEGKKGTIFHGLSINKDEYTLMKDNENKSLTKGEESQEGKERPNKVDNVIVSFFKVHLCLFSLLLLLLLLLLFVVVCLFKYV